MPPLNRMFESIAWPMWNNSTRTELSALYVSEHQNHSANSSGGANNVPSGGWFDPINDTIS